MFRSIWLCAIVMSAILNCTYSHSQTVPGVHPQHYQQYEQQQPPQQYQQQQQQQQQYQPQQQQYQQQQQFQPSQHQQHQQQNQPPMQHHQQQQQHQQGHGHHQNQRVLGGNIQEEKAHIQEHMEVPIDTSKMSEQELQFHYFKMHDSDNNNKLDGSELIKSLIHWHEEGGKAPNTPHTDNKIFTDEELIELIMPILKMDDSNDDGYIDYHEFVNAQKKAAENAPRPKN